MTVITAMRIAKSAGSDLPYGSEAEAAFTRDFGTTIVDS
jgi:hypothetical protein